jgi:hypothetical protein
MKNAFDYSMDFEKINFRERKEWYRIGKGEQGVLLVEPYKSEILPHWRFKTPEIAEKSSEIIYGLFLEYGRNSDFPGMDMARKFLQMGYTRSRRYANHKSGKKYDGPVPKDKKGRSGSHGRNQLPLNKDDEKAESAAKFYTVWEKARKNELYQKLKMEHIKNSEKHMNENFPQRSYYINNK